MLSRVFYESRIVGNFGPLALLSLQKKCSKRNIDEGITSFLYFDKTRIFQVLEGDPKAVDDTMVRIAAHNVHGDLKIRAIMKCTERQFKHWAFGGTNVDDADFKRALNASHQSDFFSMDVLQAERLLHMIASRKRRAVKVDDYSIKLRNFNTKKQPRGLFAAAKKAKPKKPGRVFAPAEPLVRAAVG